MFVLMMAALAVWVKGASYLHQVRAGQASAFQGLSDLAFLLVALILVAIAAGTLRQLRSQTGPGRGSESRGGNGVPSFRETLRQLPKAVHMAFSHRPLLASILTLTLAVIPFGMVAMSVGGWKKMHVHEWALIGVAELPIAVVFLLALIGRRSDH